MFMARSLLSPISVPRGIAALNNSFLILIADRNRNIRNLLQRELMAEGYRVRVAKDDREVLAHISSEERPSLVILDLEIPYGGSVELVEKLKAVNPFLPVVIYTQYTEYEQHPSLEDMAGFVEKGGNVDNLKIKIRETLQRTYPAQFSI
jgi:DNA-binding NtrC family response regulator